MKKEKQFGGRTLGIVKEYFFRNTTGYFRPYCFWIGFIFVVIVGFSLSKYFLGNEAPINNGWRENTTKTFEIISILNNSPEHPKVMVKCKENDHIYVFELSAYHFLTYNKPGQVIKLKRSWKRLYRDDQEVEGDWKEFYEKFDVPFKIWGPTLLLIILSVLFFRLWWKGEDIECCTDNLFTIIFVSSWIFAIVSTIIIFVQG